MRIQHNILAMNSYRNYSNNTNALGKNLEKLSSGYKINRAGDDAAGLAISEKMRAQIQGLNAAQKNVKDGISLVKTAEGAMQEIQDMLSRMKYLATQSANGTYDDDVDRANLQEEVDALVDEIDRIASSANFNGIALLDGKMGPLSKGSGSGDGDGDGDGVGETSFASAYGIDVAKLTQVKDSETKLEKVEIKLADELKEINFGSGTATLNANASKIENATITVTVTIGSVSTSVTITLKANPSPTDVSQVPVSAADTYSQLQSAIEDAILKSLQEKLGAPAADGKEYISRVALDLKEDGTIQGVDVYTAKFEGGGKVEKNTTFTIDPKSLGKDAEKLISDDPVSIGGVYFKFVKAGSTEDASKAAALEGAGTKDNPYIVEISGDEEADGKAIAQAIAQATKDSKEDLGFTAEFNESTGKLTIKATKEFESQEAFAAAVADALPASMASVATALEQLINDADPDDDGKGGGTGKLVLQIGDTGADYNKLEVKIDDMHAAALKVDTLSVSTLENAQKAVDSIEDAINAVSKQRGKLGAIQNRLEHTANNLSVMAENIQDAESTVRDTDVADEMMGYVKNNILVQSAQAMLAQANQVPQGVLQLLG